jgi:transcriptional regulator with XRE-family HTH domain
MKKNAKLESIRKRIPQEVKRMIDHSFAIVDRIDEIMIDKDISQRQLADMLEKKESEISKWMRGTHNFTIKTIAKLEAVLGESILAVSTNKPSIFVFQAQNDQFSSAIGIRGVRGELDKAPKDFIESHTNIDNLCDQLN